MTFFKMPILNLKNKISTLKKIWENQGLKGVIKFVNIRLFGRKLNYQKWIKNNTLTPPDILKYKKESLDFARKTKFSLVLVSRGDNYDSYELLVNTIESCVNQIYEQWELLIVSKDSLNIAQNDSRIKLVNEFDWKLITGEYIVFLPPNDQLAINALFENAKLINHYGDADFIYSDEDQIDLKGKSHNPFFKPDWAPEYFHSFMYTGQLGVYRTELVKKIIDFYQGFDEVQYYDFVLKFTENTNNIYHIPKILYHRHYSQSSRENVANPEIAKILQNMLERGEYKGSVEKTEYPGLWRIRRNIGNPLVSIIIPSAGKKIQTSKGFICLLENCIESVQKLSTYRNFEIIVVDGYDISQETLEKITAENVHFVHCNEPFNFSRRINQGAVMAKGEFLLLLNDDTEVITPEWIESLLEIAQQKEIGAVGAKLFFPDGKIQHVGVIIPNCNPCHAFHKAKANHSGYFYSNIVNRNYLAVTGACLMMSKNVFWKIGGMNETLPLNFNDVDLCLKAHRAGYRNVFTPYAQLIHYEFATRPKTEKPGERENLCAQWQDYLNGLTQDPYYNPNLCNDSLNFEYDI